MKLQEIRKYKGFTQEKASQIANIPLRTYKRLETDPEYENTLKYRTICTLISNAKSSLKLSTKIKRRKLTILGCGYVGLTSGILLSKKYDIEFVDVDKKVCALTRTKYGFECYEQLDDVKDFEIVLIALPTNLNEKTQKFELGVVEKYIDYVCKHSRNALIVIRSTVSIGFTASQINKHNRNILFVPEFLREESALQDALNPNRIVIGQDRVTRLSEEFVAGLSSCFNNAAPIIKMKTKEAEATKLFSNAYLATRLAFFNEVDSFSTDEDIDSNKIIKGMGFDPRIGDYYNEPGCGYSGYCLPKDTKALRTQTKSDLLKGVISSNEKRKENVASRIIDEARKINENPTIGFYGYGLSDNSKKQRPSAILEIIEILRKYSVKVVVFDENYSDADNKIDEFLTTSDLVVYKKYNDSLQKVEHLINIKR